MEIIKALWYIRKVRIYEALVGKMTKGREVLKNKQAKYQEKADAYRIKVEEQNKI